MTPHADTIERLRLELAQAITYCERVSRPAHMVRNCPSDTQAIDQAWRHRQNLEFQINQLEKSNAIRLHEHAR
jgi:hypothetical protein